MMKKHLVKIIKQSNCFMYLIAAIYSLPSILRIKGIKRNQIELKCAFIKNSRINIKGKNNRIIITPENRLNNCLLYIRGNNCEIIIDKHCILSNLELWIEDDGGKIIVGYRTTVEGGHIAATEGKTIAIGEDCMFSNNIEIRNGDSHAIFDKTNEQRTNNAKSIKIGDHVWLGSDVKVLKGSIIGDNAIVSTGAIVTGLIENNSINAGIPSKKIKDNIYWTRDRK